MAAPGVITSVADALAALAVSLGASASDSDVAELRSQLFDAPPGSPVDYERLAPAFAGRYLVRNYFKVAAATSAALDALGVTPAPHWRVLDVGAGSGASGAGVVAALAASGRSACARVELSMVERSDRQAALAEQVLSTISSHMSGQQLCWSRLSAPMPAAYELVTLSHVLCEVPVPRDLLEDALAAVAPGGVLVVVEQVTSPVWPAVGFDLGRPGWRCWTEEMSIACDDLEVRFRVAAVRRP